MTAGLLSAASWRPVRAADAPVTFGHTSVFLDSDVQLLAQLEQYLSRHSGRVVQLVKRRTYQEISALLLSGQLDAAWICGFPYVQYADRLAVIAVPVWRGEPLYQSYIVVNAESRAQTLYDLRGTIHAFSDPDSNSGYLVTRHLLATMEETPQNFFHRTFFTYGHRNVVRAVSSGLAQSGSVDGYVWEVMRDLEPGLVAQTRVLRRSEKLGFPPIAANIRLRNSPAVRAIARALIEMSQDDQGRAVLATLRLDGFIPGTPGLFEGIAAKYRLVRSAS